jgi:hypothetical protein
LRRTGLSATVAGERFVNRRFHPPNGPLYAGLILLFAAGCGSREDYDSATTVSEPGVAASGSSASGTGSPQAKSAGTSKSDEEKKAILDSIIQLIKSAPTNPGGDNFTIAIEQLNQYFAGVSPQEFKMGEAERTYLLPRIKQKGVEDLESPVFQIRDARHIEDCILYNMIAGRVAGDGDDLTRVRRVFDWMVRQVQLVPAGSLAPPGAEQAQARPYDVLLRGMATEQGSWAERSWLFMALCRPLDIDVGLIHIVPRSRGLMLQDPESAEQEAVWACGALIDGKVYLFDARLGVAIPGPGGHGVATLDQAASDPSILARLDLPGVSPYKTKPPDLARGKLRVALDSTLGYLSPRMRQLQVNLVGKQRMTLFRDPSEVEAAFRKALGPRYGSADLWGMPMEVEFRLFNDPGFVRASQFAIALFDAKLPLLPARMGQLRGDLKDAVEQYVSFRFPLQPLVSNGQAVPRQLQDRLDLYATYFLGLAKLDQNDTKSAEFFFRETLRLMPEPGQDAFSYYRMYRWGAQSNLGQLNELKGNVPLAIRYYCETKPTGQMHGDLLRARDLIWKDPFVPGPTQSPQGAPAPNTVAGVGR